jgi:hypothetical protein
VRFLKDEHRAEDPTPELRFGLSKPIGRHAMILRETDPSGKFCYALLIWPRAGEGEKTLKIDAELTAVYPGNSFSWPEEQPLCVTFSPAKDAKEVALMHADFQEKYALDSAVKLPARTLSVLHAAGRIAQLRAAGKEDEARKMALEAALVTPETAFVTIDAKKP